MEIIEQVFTSPLSSNQRCQSTEQGSEINHGESGPHLPPSLK